MTPKTKTTTKPNSKSYSAQSYRPNTDKVSNTSQGFSPVGNAKLYHTTITTSGNADTPCQDDMVRLGAPSDRRYDPAFQTTVDQSKRVPQVKRMRHSVDSPDAISRYGDAVYRQIGKDSGHKGPFYKEHSVADNAAVSRMSTGQVSINSPISSGINKAGGSIGKPTKGIN